MRVLSLFDGKSSGYTALNLANIPITQYFASEINAYAIQVSKALYSDIIHLGDIRDVRSKDLPKIDLLIGGSPCQGFSFAGKQLNFSDPRSALFFEFVRLLKECKPKYFMFENVPMKKEFQVAISKHLGCEPIKINSALVSAQNRIRLYWTNIPGVVQPENREIMLKDVLEDLPSDLVGLAVREKSKTVRVGGRGSPFNSKQEWDVPFKILNKKYEAKKSIVPDRWGDSGCNHSDMNTLVIQRPRGKNKGGLKAKKGKTPTVTSNSWQHNNYVMKGDTIRRFSTKECFRLQTVPEKLIDKILACGVSNPQLYKIAGKGWTDEVVAHIFKNLKIRHVK